MNALDPDSGPDPAQERLPERSSQVGWTLFGTGVLVHDEPRHQVSVLSLAGALVWDACDGRTTVGELASALAAETGAPPEQLVPEIRAQVAQLVATGLVGRPPAPEVPSVPLPPAEPVSGRWVTPALRVLESAVVVCCDDAAVRDHLVAVFADLVETDASWLAASGEPAAFGVQATEAGLRLHGQGYDRTFDDLDQLADGLASQLNRVVTSSAQVVALHAGAVRAPDGRVVAVTGPSGAGKSTLVAALVRAGWDYVTDEALGIRAHDLVAVGYPKPLALDATSRSLVQVPEVGAPLLAPRDLRSEALAIGGAAGPLAAVVLVERRATGAEATDPVVGPLSPEDALAAVAPQLLNLTATGQLGLDALARVALEVPVWVLREPDLGAAVGQMAAFLA